MSARFDDVVQHVVAAGHRLEYFWTRERRNREPVLIFLHEGLGSAALWRDFPTQLARATGLPGLVYSRYGHGASDVLEDGRAVTYMHDEALMSLPELRNELALDDVILVGHSDGASIALIHAAAADLPVRSVILEAPHVVVEDLTIASIEHAAEAYMNSALADRIARHHADGAKTFFGWNRIWLDPAFRSWSIEEHLPNVRCPVLVVQGMDDEYGTLLQVDRIVQRCSGPVQTFVLPDCRHAPHRDHPETVLGRMTKFIEQSLQPAVRTEVSG
ncbi:MAG: alpha/beta hydrolase [Rhodospirillales bacterium]|nr:alpha/beta hydrolase [Rhodospirillales bacterium]